MKCKPQKKKQERRKRIKWKQKRKDREKQLIKKLVSELKKMNPELHFLYDAENREVYVTTQCVWLLKFPQDWELVWGRSRREFYAHRYVILKKGEYSVYIQYAFDN